MKYMRALFFLLCFAALADDSPSGLSGGFAVFPRCQSASAPIQLAKQMKWVVYAQSDRPELIKELRRGAEAEGLLNTKLYVRNGDAADLPLASRLADLLVVDDLASGDLTPANLAAWKRVLGCRRGTVLLKGSVAPDAIRKWLTGFDDVQVVDGWVRARRPAEAGMDEWTHRLHGPNNNLVSDDRYFKAPFLAQWYGLPLHDAYWGSTVVSAGGRVMTITASGQFGGVTVSCRSLNSGVIFWERYYVGTKKDGYQGGYWPGRSCAIADDEQFLLVEGIEILRLAPETGTELGRVKFPQPKGQIQWMVKSGDTVAVLVGNEDHYKPGTLQTHLKDPTGSVLAAYDATSWNLKWKLTTDAPVDLRRIAVLGDRVFYHANGKHARCRELDTGKVIWTQNDSAVVKKIEARNSKISGELYSVRWLLATEDGLLFGNKVHKQQVALDSRTGKELWSQDVKKNWARSLRGMVVNGIHYGSKTRILKTGKELKHVRVPSGGCGPTSATPQFFLAGFGQIKAINSGKGYWSNDSKSPCDIGASVSDGIMFNAGGRCRCNMETKGYRALAAQAEFEPHTADDDSRLTPGNGKVNTVPATAADWPGYRGGTSRSGSSPVAISGDVKLAWHWKPAATPPEGIKRPKGHSFSEEGVHGSSAETEYIPSAAIAVGSSAYLVDMQGIVRSFDLGSGKLRWSYPLGGKAFEPPTYWKGALYASCADGYLYCLSAAGGELVWRFRAAPHQRLNFWYGHLASTWPLVAGTVLHEGICYLAAGFHGENGVSVWALDAKTGKVRWQKHDAGKSAHAFGSMTIAGGRLWLASGTFAPVSFALADGSIRKSPNNRVNRGMTRGKLVGALTDELIIEGGRRVVMTHEFWNKNERGIVLNAHPTAEWEVPGVVGTTLIDGDGPSLLPAWDDALLVSVGAAGKGLCAWPVATIVDQAKTKLAKKPKKISRQNPGVITDTGSKEVKLHRNKAKLPDGRLWGPGKDDCIAMVLAKNAIVTVSSDKGWHLVAHSRKDGSELWRQTLPGKALMDGIAIARDGSILIPLIDGGIVCYR